MSSDQIPPTRRHVSLLGASQLMVLGIVSAATPACREAAEPAGPSFKVTTEKKPTIATYSATDLGSLGGGGTNPIDINGKDQVVGFSRTSSGLVRAFLWDNGLMTNLGILPGGDQGLGTNSSQANGINDKGDAVGASTSATGSLRAVLWQDGTITELGTLAGFGESYASAINEKRQAVGWSTVNAPGFPRHAFLWQDGTMLDLGTLGGSASSAHAINDRGWVVGESQTASGETHAFLWRDGTMFDLGTLGGNASSANAITAEGIVVGFSYLGDFASTPSRAVVWADGTITDLGCDLGCLAYDVSDDGLIVGSGGFATFGWLWQGGSLVELSTLLDVAPTFASPNAVNKGGWIVGQSTASTGAPLAGTLWVPAK